MSMDSELGAPTTQDPPGLDDAGSHGAISHDGPSRMGVQKSDDEPGTKEDVTMGSSHPEDEARNPDEMDIDGERESDRLKLRLLQRDVLNYHSDFSNQ